MLNNKYNKIITEIKSSKLSMKIITLIYRRLKCFDVMTIGDSQKRIEQLSRNNSNVYTILF